MINNYLKSSWRNLRRDKAYSAINISGLAVGLAICLVIVLFVRHELSYDTFHEKSDRIYRTHIKGRFGDTDLNSLFMANPLKDALIKEYPEVKHVTRFKDIRRTLIKYKDKSILEDGFFYADKDFFNVFTFPLIKGDPNTALSEPNQVVMTESTARKYFGEEDPMGEMIRLEDSVAYKVSGICRDVPANSHFHFNMLASYKNYWFSDNDLWINTNVYTYFTLKKGQDPAAFEKKLKLLVDEYVGPEVTKLMGVDLEEFERQGSSYGFHLQPLEKIYLHSNMDNEVQPTGDYSRIWYFSLIAGFILIIACINFMNLATARYGNRAREVGIRKVVGSKKGQLIGQFLTESVLVSFFALVIAIALVELLLPVFNNIAQKELTLQYFGDPLVIPSLFLFAIFIGLLAGTYPSFFLSSFKPVSVLKGKLNQGVSGNTLRGVLVTVQFVITIALFISTYIIYQQNQLLMNKNLGFDKEKVVVIERAHLLDDRVNSFIQELEKNSGIERASASSCIPGSNFGGTTFQVEGKSAEEMVQFAFNNVDGRYIETMGLKLKKGRFFSSEYSGEEDKIVINSIGAEKIGLENPLDKHLTIAENVYEIIGVVEDYHFESLHKDIRPLCLGCEKNNYQNYITVRLNTGELSSNLKVIQDEWEAFLPGQPFSYFFMDNNFEKLYNNETRMARIFTIFSILAILIACLGLLGLSAFAAEKRSREISIRKTMGASVSHILHMLYREVVLLLIIAIAISWPLTYYLMSHWLENFAFRIGLGFGPFIIASIAALAIAIFTTSFQALKAAHANPANTLRDE